LEKTQFKPALSPNNVSGNDASGNDRTEMTRNVVKGGDFKINESSAGSMDASFVAEQNVLKERYINRAKNDRMVMNHGMTFVVAIVGACIAYRVINVLAF